MHEYGYIKYTQDGYDYNYNYYLLNDDGDYGYNHHDGRHYRLSC